MQKTLMAAYERLLAAYGPQGWWPADSPFEVVVGAVLVQNTAWANVERAIAALQAAGVLQPQTLYDLPAAELERLIRPAGAYRVKSRRLRNLLRLIVDGYGGSLDALFFLETEKLREALLAVNGVGKETADAIVLYAAGRPRFVVDAYTRRVLSRHGWLADGESDYRYDAMQSLFEQNLDADAALFNEFHALIVAVAKHHCRVKPKCDGCPLATMLPAGGPLG